MEVDPAVSHLLQQAAEQLHGAIQSARESRTCYDKEESLRIEKMWRLAAASGQEIDDCDESSDERAHDATCPSDESSDNNVTMTDTSFAWETWLQSPTKSDRDTIVRKREGLYENCDIKEDRARAETKDLERQASETRAVRETLARVIHDMTDMIADLLPPEEATILVHTAVAASGMSFDDNNETSMCPLVPDKVKELVGMWDDALVFWREQNLAEKRKLRRQFEDFEDECIVRMRASEASHKLMREQLMLETDQVRMQSEDYMSCSSLKLEKAYKSIEALETQVADLKAQLAVATATKIGPFLSEASTETDQKEIVDENENLEQHFGKLAARVKLAEDHALRCQVALTEQLQRANEVENRLHMLLEECQARNIQRQSHSKLDQFVHLYGQKLELLEGRMQDVMQQVACDHEQFEYEQAKWALEKRQHRERYDEVLDASVKVLKVLIIREKIMKKNERMLQQSSEGCKAKQLELACQAATLQRVTEELMQQSALVLLESMANTDPSKKNTARSSEKTVQMKPIIKRLKKINAVLSRRDRMSHEEASSFISTPRAKVSPYP